jgi:hopanoid biosynthesis associated protein HpnK
VNADDFGLSAGVNRGIEESFRCGILRSASLMPNGEAFADAVRIARQLPGLGVGIHLSLVGERSLAPREASGSLVDEHGFLPASYAEFARGYFLGRFTLRAIRREVDAQIQRVLDTGIRPTHLDSHQHLHLFPGIFKIAIEAAHAANIGVIRVPHEQGLSPRFRVSPRAMRLLVLNIFCRHAKRMALARGLHVAHHFWGLEFSGSLGESELLRILENVSSGINEVMMHPGISDKTMQGKYPWGYKWDMETAALRSSAVRQLIAERRIRLASFEEAWRP